MSNLNSCWWGAVHEGVLSGDTHYKNTHPPRERLCMAPFAFRLDRLFRNANGAWAQVVHKLSFVSPPNPPKDQPCGPRASDCKRSEPAKRGHYLQTLMTSRNIDTRVAWWPVHKKSRVRRIGRMEHAFRPVGLRVSHERPARLTDILNYLEKVRCHP